MLGSRRAYVGRRREREALGTSLRRGGALLLTGEAGIGKTRLAEQLAAQLGAPAAIQASTGLSAVPFGALSPLFARFGVRTTDAADALVALHTALGHDHDTVIVVDDVPRLDGASVAVVEQLVRGAACPVVLTARDGEPLPEAVQKLLDEGSVVAHEVRGLQIDDVARLLELLVGGPIHPTTLRTVASESGGAPLVIHELVAGARAAGVLRHGRHGWEMPGVVANRRLIDMVEARFADLDEALRPSLELLAAAQPLPLAVLDHEIVERLVEVQLVVADPNVAGAFDVRLAHPLYDDVLRAMAPAIRWRRRQREASELLATTGAADDEFRSVALALDAGGPLDLDRAQRAAVRAASRSAYGLALSLADAVLAERPEAFDALLVRGTALAADGDDRARDALARAAAAAGDDEQRALAAHRRGIYLALRADRVAEAIDVCTAALERIGDDDWRQFLAADLVKWRMMDGRVAEPLTEPVGGTGAARLNHCLIAALLGTMSGDLAASDAAVDEGLPLARIHRAELPNAEDLLYLSRFLGRAFAGDLPAARALAEKQLQQRTDREDEQVGMWSYALGVAMLHTGYAQRTGELADAAITHLEWRDFTGLRPVARALKATALAQRARSAEARESLDAVPEASLADQKVALQCAQARAWLLAAEGRRADAVELLASAGRAGIANGHEMLAALTSYEAVRLGGAASVVGDLAALAGRAPATMVDVLLEHAEAAVAADPNRLMVVADRLSAMGFATAAADAASQAATAFDAAGRETRARAARRRAEVLADGCDGARGAAGVAPMLTPREREVAAAAAGRLRSREIAERLGVSPRTVDNHLARIYRKLDVSNRDAMAAALAELGLADGDAAGREPPYRASFL
ncbi:MAG: hypothetical protein ITG02_12555 [Patulibacter sp.]|nr:hypothetical protein [Patulibacter sp.]